jgi:hypothetical protein
MSTPSLPAGEEVEKDASVYDFVYVDQERIAAALSQFDDNGNLVKLSRSDVRKNAKRGEASLPGVAKGQFDRGYEESVGKEYDPAWLAPLNFLDELDCRSMINRDIENAKIGQYVLISGGISVTDLSLLHGIWSVPAIKSFMVAALDQSAKDAEEPKSRQQRRASKAKANPKEVAEAEVAVALISMMPHYLQVTVGDHENAAWFNLDPAKMRVPLGEFALKHGVFIPGTWHALGILDALPEDRTDLEKPFYPSKNLLGNSLGELATPIRSMLGRPFDNYGITPVILFRQVET